MAVGTVYLVDGTYTVFRAYYALTRLTAPDGTPTNAVFGFVNQLRKIVRERTPEHFGVAFDLEGPTLREEKYAEYKANRPAPPEDLAPQFALAMEAARLLGWPVLAAPGFEADDVLGTLALKARAAGLEVVIVTSDKDLYQLVREGVRVLNLAKDERILDEDGVREIFGAPPERVVDVLALMGDAVDNVPGVPGVGEKTAKALVGRYGRVSTVLSRARLFAQLWAAREAGLAALDAGEAPALEDLRAAAIALAAGERAVGGEDDETARRFAALAELDSAAPPKTLRKALADLDKKTQSKIWLSIDAHADDALLSLDLATIRTDAPVDLDLEAMRPGCPDAAAAASFFRTLGFRQLSAELEAGESGAPAPAAPADEGAPARDAAKDGAGAAKRGAAKDGAGAAKRGAAAPSGPTLFDVPEETRIEFAPAGAAIAAARAAGRAAVGACYVPGAGKPRLAAIAVAAPDGSLVEARRAAEIDAPFAALLADAALPKVGHDLKTIAGALRCAAGRTAGATRGAAAPFAGAGFDALLAAQMLDPDRAAPSSAIEGAARLGLGGAAEAADPLAVAAADALAAARLAAPLAASLERGGLDGVFEEIEMPLVPVLEEMEARGILVDAGRLGELSSLFAEQLAVLEKEIHQLAGRPFNIASPPQLRAVLFDELKLEPVGRRTQKTKAYSTNQDVLEQLAERHPLPGKVLEHRELSKLKGTYVDALPRLVDQADGRVHTLFHQLGAATGRLSSSDPNLQNIPVRTDLGRRIRAAFVPAAGFSFLSADYSQMELRILAHLAGDPELTAAFLSGADIHRHTAALVAGIDPAEVTPRLRAAAKAVNFGIVYGMSEFRLAREQGMSLEEAREFIDAYFRRYPKVKEYIADTTREVLRTGEVRTLFGRVRRFPELVGGGEGARNRAVREALVRQAVNATVQGTGADIVKKAMKGVADRLRSAKLSSRLILQVHDELLLETARGEEDEVRRLVVEAMEGAAKLAAPLTVDARIAEDWAAAH